MSTIVAVQKNGRIAIAWDTMSMAGSTRCLNATGPSKVSRVGSSLIGSSGFTVYRNLLDHYLARRKPPRLSDEKSILEFFLQFWRDLHSQYHFVDDQSDSEDSSPFADLCSEFLVANPHGIFRVKEILSVSRYERFCAIGSGTPHAEGAAQVLFGLNERAADIAEKATRVALEFDAGSGGNVEVLDVPEHRDKTRKRARAKTKKKKTR